MHELSPIFFLNLNKPNVITSFQIKYFLQFIIVINIPNLYVIFVDEMYLFNYFKLIYRPDSELYIFF